MAKVCIVIVNYNGENYQNDCIRTLYEMNYTDFEIIVIDSGSKDNSIKKLRKQYPQVNTIMCNENVGVAAGNNIGIKYSIKSGAEYTLLLNNDTEVDKNMLSELIKASSESVVTVPKIYFFNPKNILWFAGGTLRWKNASAEHIGNGEVDKGQYDSSCEITYSPTCCMLINNKIFETVGLMDEKMFMYFDDTDFCARLNLAGVKIKYVPKSIVWHKVSSSAGGSNSKITVYYNNRNQLYYMKKYKKMISRSTTIKVIVKGILKSLLGRFRNRPNDKYIAVGYVDYIKGNMGRKDF